MPSISPATFWISAATALLVASSSLALADAGHGGHFDFGQPGKKADAKRTVEIVIRDNVYEPDAVTVKAGETVRFVVKNPGEFLHEFNLGTPKMHEEHQKEMAMMVEHGMLTATEINHEMMKMDHSKMGMPAMKHDDPNSVLIEPGKTVELIWKFTKPATLEFACNLPGHYEAGMVGKINFQK